MSSFTIKNCKQRFILLNEWKSRNSIDETKRIINQRFGENSITSTKVQKWFKRFDKRSTLIFDKESPLSVFIQNHSCDPFNSLLFLSDEKHDGFEFIKCDARFIEYYYCIKNKNFFVLYDLFLNERKVVEFPFESHGFVMIGNVDGFLLAFNNDENRIYLFRIDYKNLTFNLLDTVIVDDDFYYIHVDQLNPNKFFITRGRQFAMGKIENEKIVFGEFKELPGSIFYYGQRLMNNKLQGLDFNGDSIKFMEFNLGTMTESEIDASFDFNELDVLNFQTDVYYWSNNCFYVMFEMSDKQHHLFMFNTDELKWSNMNIVTRNAENLFINSNELLTLCVGQYPHKINAFYRFNLRKPESLKNLAHLAILRQSTLFGEDKYLNCVKKLPIQF